MYYEEINLYKYRWIIIKYFKFILNNMQECFWCIYIFFLIFWSHFSRFYSTNSVYRKKFLQYGGKNLNLKKLHIVHLHFFIKVNWESLERQKICRKICHFWPNGKYQKEYFSCMCKKNFCNLPCHIFIV